MKAIRIDGKAIADTLLTRLTRDIQEQGIHPRLLVFFLGNNSSSRSYILQKQHAAEQVGISCDIYQYSEHTSPLVIRSDIQKANEDNTIHGIIVQRPLPSWSTNERTSIVNTINPLKDVDGFTPTSPHTPPSATAVFTILDHIYQHEYKQWFPNTHAWLRSQRIVVIGKGETAGAPIRSLLNRHGIPYIGIDRSTHSPTTIIKTADILISCVGKRHTIQSQNMKEGSILISVGLIKQNNETLYGDYDEDDIHNKARYYTPTPGGVGPITVACLMQNVTQACIILQKGGSTP